MKRTIVIGFILLLGVLFVFNKPIFDIKLRTSALVGDFAGFNSDELGAKIEELERENNFLREELQNKTGQNLQNIKVYSSYPFNSRSEIAIAGGEDGGIQVGDTVVFGGDALVGQVVRVFNSSSIVRTILDPTEEIAVRIGENEVDALLRGGNEITLTLIPQDSEVNAGDKVFTASQGFPYGLEIGVVREIKDSDEGVFKEAILTPSFSIKSLRDVSILR